MSKMAELFDELNYPELTYAECAECGVEIAFASDEEFAKLSAEHACILYQACQWYLVK